MSGCTTNGSQMSAAEKWQLKLDEGTIFIGERDEGRVMDCKQENPVLDFGAVWLMALQILAYIFYD